MADVIARGAFGVEACRLLSDAYDAQVRELFLQTKSPGRDRFALVATGGWGRRQVCPFSDIDFMLIGASRDLELAEPLAQEILYPLWDAGVRVGHAVRDAGALGKLAAKDLASATALLDLRLIAGDPNRLAEIEKQCRGAIAPGGNTVAFASRLAEDRAGRHERFGASLFLLEPNLKQGIGALRDLATGLWAAQARYGSEDPDQLFRAGAISARQASQLKHALDFLLALRTDIQLTLNRATDQLTFELQEKIAPRWYRSPEEPSGDVKPAVAPAVESLMREYYLHAREVVQLTDHLLETAMTQPGRKPRVTNIDANFILFNGKLSVRDPELFSYRPAEMLRMFRVALAEKVPVYSHTRERMKERLTHEPQLLTGNPEAGQMFLQALTDVSDAGQPSVLEEMHQVGILGALMPEFAPCTCRVQHDLYHVYTVDQHQLYALAMLKRLARGELKEEHPLATEVLASISNVLPLYLGTLLHDVGKPLGKGHSEKGARLTDAIATRLQIAKPDRERAAFLVGEHLTMSHLSQRRDLTDPQVIKKFAERVGDAETLAQLYVLTLCDTAMTAPGNLNAWKEQLLSELYEKTRALFGEGPDSHEPALLAQRARRRAVETMTQGLDPDERERAWVEGFTERVDDRFLAAVSHRQLVRHLALVESWRKAPEEAHLSVTAFPMKGHTEVALVARDVPGLLSCVAGVLTAHRVRIDSAVVSTCEAGGRNEVPLALDLFRVSSNDGKAIEKKDPRWDKISADLNHILKEADPLVAVEALLSKRQKSKLKPKVTPGVATDIRIINDASEHFTVVEVSTQDRVGALYAMTATLARKGLDIHVAKVSTEGERIADAFYVAGRNGGGKITAEAELAALKTAMAEALSRLAAEGR